MTPEQIRRDTGLFGLVGDALEKTPLPNMVNAFYDFNALNAFCSIFNIREEDIPFFLTNIKGKTIKGLFIQPSHAPKVLEHIDRFSPESEASGAVDSIVIEEGRLQGECFKAAGISRELAAEGGLAGKTVALMGSDATALATAFCLASQEPKKMLLVDPAPEAALALSQKIKAFGGYDAFEIERCGERVVADLGTADVVISCLELDGGMRFSDLKAGARVYDCDGSFNGASRQKEVHYRGPYYMTLLTVQMMSDRVFGVKSRIDENFMESAEVIEIF